MNKRSTLVTAAILVTLVLAFLPINAKATGERPKIISFATLPPGTNSYAITVVLCDVMNKFSGHKVTAEPIGSMGKWGSLMETGEVHLGLSTVLTTKNILKRLGKTTRTTKARTLGSGHFTKYVFVVRGDAGIKRISDLKGKKVFTTWRAAAHNRVVKLVLEQYGLTGKLTELKIASPADVYKGIIEGRVDAAFWTISPQAAEVKRTRGLTVFGIPADVTKAISKIEPSILASSYPKGYLGILKEKVPTIGARVLVYVYADIADDVVYNLMRALHDHNDELKAGYARAAQYRLDNIPWETEIPFHPGAIKFYKDSGIWDAKAKALQKKLLKGP